MIRCTLSRAFLCAFFLIPAAAERSFADVKVQLRNGGSITADDCREESDRFVCFKMGGAFEIDRKDVVSIKNVGAGAPSGRDTEPAENRQAADGAGPGGGAKKTDPGKEAKTADPSSEKDPLVARAAELRDERERLIREKQQLDEDIKNAPVWMPVNQFDSLQKRSAEMEEKIKKFNEEIQKLKEESSKRQSVPAK
ncbi:MAG: hypothetical protein HZB33_07540 [Nitrospirae bacterium]|nr:hypothetical protein [Nitrospirota bacterium]